MNEVGLTHLSNEEIHHLSGGEKQRVFIAKALTQKPQILLLDEPTNHLDMKYKVALMEQLRAFKGTTIVVLHDLNLAAQYCDHIVIMNNGTILKEGSPTEVLTPEILDQFLKFLSKPLGMKGAIIYIIISKERTYYVSEFKEVKKIIINRNDMCYIRYCWLWF